MNAENEINFSEGLSLLEKFKEKQKSLNLIQPKQKEINQNFEKLEYFEESINLKDDEVFHLEQAKAEFFDFFDKQFSDCYNCEDLSEYRTAIAEVEQLIYEYQIEKNKREEELNSLNNDKNNQFKISKKNLNKFDSTINGGRIRNFRQSQSYKKFEQKFKEIYTFLENLDIDSNKENEAIENIKLMSKNVKDFYYSEMKEKYNFKNEEIFSADTKNKNNLSANDIFYNLPLNYQNKFENLNEIRNLNFSPQDNPDDFITKRENVIHNIHINVNNDSGKKPSKRRDKLLSTAFIKKSKSIYGEDDLIFSPDQEDVGNNINYDNSIQPSTLDNHPLLKGDKMKLKLRNFLQIYLVKENEIFSQSYYSKFDPSVLYSYRKYKFYEVKLCISSLDSLENIKTYINQIKSLFLKYFLIYKSDNRRNFFKVIISGVGRRQAEVKQFLIKYINQVIEKDCLIKISFFSNLFDCMRENITKVSLNKLDKDRDYAFTTNFTDEHLNKIITKMNG